MLFMNLLRYLLFFVLILSYSQTQAQTKMCMDSAIYHTSDLGNGIEQLVIPLKFKVYPDSIFIRADTPDERASFMDVSFKILKKSCQWNNDFSEGISLYEVISNDPKGSKKAIINIRLNNKKGRIQLLYENAEPRIFTIKNN